MFGLFHGGIRPGFHKELTRSKQIETLTPPSRVFLPLPDGLEPLVSTGDAVDMGQAVAAPKTKLQAALHASVSGKVIAIEDLPHPGGHVFPTIVVENDFEERTRGDNLPRGSVESLSSQHLISIISACGITGLVSGVPAELKISRSLAHARQLVINGCECEPLLTCDHRLMLEYAEDIFGGTRALMKIFGVKRAVIAVLSNMVDAAARLSETLPSGSSVSIRLMSSKYPQGSAPQLLTSLFGRKAGRVPDNPAYPVFNAATVVAIHRAITMGMPLISRVVTVAGSAVSNPKNLLVRIGSPVSGVFEAAGGFREPPGKIIMGGPISAVSVHTLNMPVLKTTRGLLAFAPGDAALKDSGSCIRCARCVRACPMKLLPTFMYSFERTGGLEQCRELGISSCIECGACSYVCPSRLQLLQSFRLAKHKLSLKAQNPTESSVD